MDQEIHYKLDYSKNLFTIAIDIGGTLAKVVYSPLGSDKLHFHTIETEHITKFIKLLHSIIHDHNNSDYSTTQIIATGGGAFKFYDLLNKEFPLVKSIDQLEEMESLIKGLDFFIHQVHDEVFTYNDQDGMQIIPKVTIDNNKCQNEKYENNDKIYPYLLVNIGSGVSILKVEKPNVFTRVGGSSLGGGTLWGLLSLITGAQSYDQMLTWAQEGDNTQVDMLVGDIYGSDYTKIGLKSSAIASSFGKVFQNRRLSTASSTPSSRSNSTPSLSNIMMLSAKDCSNDDNDLLKRSTTSTLEIMDRNKKFQNSDICKSLLYAISNNIGQIAYLQAKIHHVQNIYFGGSYIRGHLTTMNTLCLLYTSRCV